MAPIPALYPSLHHIRDLDSATDEDLRKIIQTFPIIDNHAHNMLTEDHAYGSNEYPFECITSEAQGHALTDHVQSSLSHIRGVKQLAEFFQCPPTLQEVKATRYEWVRRDYAGLVKKCFEGTHAIMMDDGFQSSVVLPYKWHRQFVPTVSRIVRVESIAAELLEQLALAAGFLKVGLDADWDISQTEAFLVRFNTVFRNQIRTLANDSDVRGFKSVVCYRSGLDIGLDSRKNFRPHQSLTESALLASFHDFLQNAVRNNDYKIKQKEVNDYLVVAVCDILDKFVDTDGENLPFQFHTGLGDNDISLIKANPAYMQPLIEAFPNVDFVLLHSSYPYTREAGYLATNYVNAWLDIGEVYPMLSRDGEEAVLRQALELTPSSKILYSTDGHLYPETYWLANKQFRDVLETVLGEYVAIGDMTAAQAINIAVDILFFNSNALYKLDEDRKYPEVLKACGRYAGGSLHNSVNGTSKSSSFKSYASTAVDKHGTNGGARGGPSPLPPAQSASGNPLVHRPANAAVNPESTSSSALAKNQEMFDAFMQSNPSVKYIWVQFCDYTGTLRNIMVTAAAFKKILASGKNAYITTALSRLLQDDNPAQGASATGQFLMAPDLASLSLNKGIPSPSATVQTWWMADTEEIPNREHWDRCPRNALKMQTDALKTEFNIDIIMGFEVEIIFMRPIFNENKSEFVEFEPLNMVHSWANMTYQQLDTLPMIEEIVETLAEIDIHLTKFHSEAAPGQWEFPLPAFDPVKAVDVLFKAKDVIRNIARKYGLKATLYPRPYNFTCGSANHTHVSINGPAGTVEKYSDSFLAGMLEHLPAVLAFTLPLEESYARVTAGIWAGGEYACWGTQNKEVPLRKCGPGHWELKTVDGIGNMYLSMAALLAAGLYGLRQELDLGHQDCVGDPTGIGEEERQRLGITTKLPHTQEEALFALKRDEVLIKMLGENLVADYIAVKESEAKKLKGFGDKKRRIWLMSRY